MSHVRYERDETSDSQRLAVRIQLHDQDPPVVTAARQYLRGLLQSERKNMERTEQVVPASSEQSLQHFASTAVACAVVPTRVRLAQPQNRARLTSLV
jgi:hypothetical protein